MKNEMVNPLSDIIMYKKEDGSVNVEILVQDETLWLTQERMGELFGVQRPAITKHLKNIFESGELFESAVCSILEHTASDGKNYKVKYYNLDAILSVGYRVNSKQATLFRIFASQVLKEYLIKGFAMDDKRLKNPENIFGKDYFDEQLERTVQNKLHFAISGHTAAEIIYNRADSTKTHMGLTTWKNAPDGRIRKNDVRVAKNYLNESEMKNLNEIVSMYLDYAERQAKKGIIMYMTDWKERLDAFLAFNEEDIFQTLINYYWKQNYWSKQKGFFYIHEHQTSQK